MHWFRKKLASLLYCFFQSMNTMSFHLFRIFNLFHHCCIFFSIKVLHSFVRFTVKQFIFECCEWYCVFNFSVHGHILASRMKNLSCILWPCWHHLLALFFDRSFRIFHMDNHVISKNENFFLLFPFLSVYLLFPFFSLLHWLRTSRTM